MTMAFCCSLRMKNENCSSRRDMAWKEPCPTSWRRASSRQTLFRTSATGTTQRESWRGSRRSGCTSSVKKSAVLFDKVSGLAIDTEDMAIGSFLFRNKVFGLVKADYLQKGYTRR